MESIIDSATYFEGDLEILLFVVRELIGTEYQINDFSCHSTVYMLKNVLVGMSTSDWTEESICFTFGGRHLEDNDLIGSSGVTNGSVVHFVRRNRGGSRINISQYADPIPVLLNESDFDTSSDSSYDSSDEDSNEESQMSD